MVEKKELNKEELEEVNGGKLFNWTHIIYHIKYSYEENGVLKEKTDDVTHPYYSGITTAQIGREAKQYCEERGYIFISVTHSMY